MLLMAHIYTAVPSHHSLKLRETTHHVAKKSTTTSFPPAAISSLWKSESVSTFFTLLGAAAMATSNVPSASMISLSESNSMLVSCN